MTSRNSPLKGISGQSGGSEKSGILQHLFSTRKGLYSWQSIILIQMHACNAHLQFLLNYLLNCCGGPIGGKVNLYIMVPTFLFCSCPKLLFSFCNVSADNISAPLLCRKLDALLSLATSRKCYLHIQFLIWSCSIIDVLSYDFLHFKFCVLFVGFNLSWSVLTGNRVHNRNFFLACTLLLCFCFWKVWLQQH